VNYISCADFEKVDIRVGTIIEVADFPQARNPAYQLLIDFGDEIGIKRSSAQITKRYAKEALVGKQILAVVNFPEKQIGPFLSQVLVLGVSNEEGEIVLVEPGAAVPNGKKLF
jgi:tRNA-binding protein